MLTIKKLEDNTDVRDCPSCHENEFRQVYVGNDSKGWFSSGDWECDSCDYEDQEPKEMKKSNRPDYFSKLPSEIQAARKTIEMSNELSNELKK